MADDAPDDQTITLAYPEADEYRLIHASGSRGGLQPGNDFKMDLVTDLNANLETETFAVNEDGTLGESLDGTYEQDADGIREKQVGVMMSPEKALSIAGWVFQEIINGLSDAEATEEEIIKLIFEHYGVASSLEQALGDQ